MSLDADGLLDRRRLKRRIAFWRTLAIIASVAVVAVAVDRFSGIGDRDRVARLDVVGVIVENHERDEALAEVAEDDRAKALIVRIDSPGGTTAGGAALYTALRGL